VPAGKDFSFSASSGHTRLEACSGSVLSSESLQDVQRLGQRFFNEDSQMLQGLSL
jgi:hypothetical protein